MPLVDLLFPPLCAGCGRNGSIVCDDCASTLLAAPAMRAPTFVDDWVALFAYEGVARELTARVKYRNARVALPWCATALARAIERRWRATRFDAVTWAPTTNARRRTRGFDHSQLLARRVARELRVPVRALLTRTSSAAQTGRAYAQRRVGPSFRSEVPAEVNTVLLIDDVATTGATLRAAAMALRNAGAQRVFAATVARTPPPERLGGRLVRCAYTPPR